MRRVLPWILVALGALGCEPVEEEQRVRAQLVAVRLAIDPATQLGEVFLTRPEVAASFREGFARVACDGDLGAIVLDLDVTTTRGTGLGRGALYLATPVDDRDLCRGEGEVIVQPVSLDEAGEPLVAGPMFVEGLTLDGRFPIGTLFEDQLSSFPTWWRFTARLRNRVRDAPDAGLADRLELEEAEVATVWAASDVARAETPMTTMEDPTLLDTIVAEGFQPSVDVDGDGLEALADTDADGRIDRCVDGDGGALEGADCVLDPAVADGYELRLRFRVVPVTIRE
ncbi:MAG TPA: hypothetical protein RMH99_32655 [Sandaracinaceae bacterium LLY-WYZ-13_1]|nr:hypothetical protein [Sandaracinaceae bacterium LLY-WYZ-13_1]